MAWTTVPPELKPLKLPEPDFHCHTLWPVAREVRGNIWQESNAFSFSRLFYLLIEALEKLHELFFYNETEIDFRVVILHE